MPRGTIHTETGLLVDKGHALYLYRDEGGQWRLDAISNKTRQWVGRRVSIEGERDGFDILAIRKIDLC
jgi:hypothetical protein